MTIINIFSSLKRFDNYPETDILIWAAALSKYKSFGYNTKIYCMPNDLFFLAEYKLLQLYDEVDTDFLQLYELNKKVDDNIFWSDRKIEILHHEFFDLKNTDFIYTDTDVFMNIAFDISDCDVLFWSPEPRLVKFKDNGDINWDTTIYPDWKFISKPRNYKMPQYIKEIDDAYNCGVMYFKNPNIFKIYYKEYYKFTINNPCTVENGFTYNKSLFPCNAEQRILKAIITNTHQKVKFIMPEKLNGICKEGYHFFWFRTAWSNMNKYQVLPIAYVMLNTAIYESLQTLKTNCFEIYEFYKDLPWLINFEKKFFNTPDHIVLRYYY